jgi:hypothetical protein
MSSDISFYHEGENIYVNLSLYNNTQNNIPASLDISIEKPIVERADEYKMSIIRFTCFLYNIPRYYLSFNNLRVQISYLNGTNYEYYSGTAVAPLNPIDSIYAFVHTVNSAYFKPGMHLLQLILQFLIKFLISCMIQPQD